MAMCVVCQAAWDPKPMQMNFHGLCSPCFSLYDNLKRRGRMAERSGKKCSDNETFFASALFPFSEASGIERLRREINFSVSIINSGPNKARVIWVIRNATGKTLQESKHLVDNAPCKILEGLEKGLALELATRLKSLGADAKITNEKVIKNSWTAKQ